MTKTAANDDAGGSERAASHALRQALAERERQLRDLTEQSLTFLEELAESRRLNLDRDALAARISQLEHQLAETRGRLRHVGGLASGAEAVAGGAAPAALAVVHWGRGGLDDAIASLGVAGEVPVVWVGLPDAVPTGELPPNLQIVVHRDAHTPAQCFNLAMVATAADNVLLLGPGHRLAALSGWPLALPANAALLAPRVDGGGGVVELGCEDVDGLLVLRKRVVPADLRDVAAVAWPLPQAFCVRRSAYLQLGMFDEGFAGDAALVDYVLRARGRNFDVAAVPGPTVGRAIPAAAAPELAELDRLQLLATHRPDQLGRALAQSAMLRASERSVATDCLREVMRRLPTAEDLGVQRAVLEQVVLGAVQHGVPAPRVCELLRDQRVGLLRGLVDVDGLAQRDEASAALQAAAGAHLTDPAAAFAALASDIQFAHHCVLAAVQALRTVAEDRAALDVDRHAHMARAERAEGARAATQVQLDQVQTWLREVQADLRRLNEHQQDVERQMFAANQAAAASAEAVARTNVEQLQELQTLRLQLETLRSQLQERERDAGSLRQVFRAAARAASLDESIPPAVLHERIVAIHRDAATLAATLSAAGAADAQSLLHWLEDLRGRLSSAEGTILAQGRAVAERDAVIAGLLIEVRQRRLFPRPLTPAEQAMLDRLGRPQ